MKISEHARRRYEPGAEVESFYHLSGCDLVGRTCAGTACFVARNSCGDLQPGGEPRVYCLGRCFEAPATGLAGVRPRIEVHSRESVVLARLLHGGARTLDAYRSSGGYHALEKALGFSKSRGTKLVSLNSLFVRPGLYEVEFGIPVRRIVEEIGGGLRAGVLKGVMIGGPLAGIIPPGLLDTAFGFEELAAIGASVGHGGVIAFDEHTSIAALVRHVFSFGAYESCGKCTPCRLGARRVEEIFTNTTRATGDDAEWRDIVSALKSTSLCGHGTGLGAFAESVLRYYGEEVA